MLCPILDCPIWSGSSSDHGMFNVLRTLYSDEVPAAPSGMDQSHPLQVQEKVSDSGSSSSAESDCSSGCDSSGSSSDS